MRIPTLLVVWSCFLLLSSPLAAQFEANLPQVANGFLIQTTFVFFNNGDETAEVRLELRNDDGAPFVLDLAGLGVGSTHEFTLEPGQTRFFPSDGRGENRAGAARVTATSAIGVSAIFSLLGPPPNVGVLTEAGVGTSPPLADFVIAVDTTGGFNTGLAIQNLSGSPNEVTFRIAGPGVASSQGFPEGVDEVSRTLPPNGHLAVFVSGRDQLFPALSDFQGRMVVSPSAPVAAITLRQARDGFPLTTLPVVSTASLQTTFKLPQIAAGDTIQTQFVIFGLADAAGVPDQSGDVELTLTDDDGNPFEVSLSNGLSGSSFSLALESDGALFFETVGGGTPVAGAASVVSDFPIGISAIFTLNLPGRPTTEAGVGDSRALDRFTLPADLTAPFDTGLALFNDNPETASVEVAFINQDGALVQDSSLAIAPFSAERIVPSEALEPMGPSSHRSRFIGQLLPGLDLSGRQGQVTVVSTHPLSALTLRQSPTTLTTLPVSAGASDAAPEPVTPGGSELLPASREGVDLRAAATVNQKLPGGRRISGTVDTSAAVARVWALRRSDGAIFDGATNVAGDYAINVPEGAYDLLACAPTTVATLPPSFGYIGARVENVTVDSNVRRDIIVPGPATRAVTGELSNLEALPPMPSGTTGFLVFHDEQSLYVGLALIQVPLTAYLVQLADGDYRVSFGAVLGVDLDFDNVPEVLEQAIFLLDLGALSVSGSDISDANFAIPVLAGVQGTVSRAGSPVIPDGTLFVAFDRSSPVASFSEQCFPAFGGGLARVGADGGYETVVVPGRSYSFSSLLPVVGADTGEEGSWFRFAEGDPLAVAGDLTVDFPYPQQPEMVIVEGIVTDPNDVPLRDVQVSVSARDGITGAPATGYTIVTVTAADGSYTAEVLSGSSYTFTFDPGPPALAPLAGPADRE